MIKDLSIHIPIFHYSGKIDSWILFFHFSSSSKHKESNLYVIDKTTIKTIFKTKTNIKFITYQFQCRTDNKPCQLLNLIKYWVFQIFAYCKRLYNLVPHQQQKTKTKIEFTICLIKSRIDNKPSQLVNIEPLITLLEWKFQKKIWA